MDEQELLFWDAFSTFDPCLTWQACDFCLLNSVCIWPKGKWAYADIRCLDCGYNTWTTRLLATAN